jgi:hypothetical protein
MKTKEKEITFKNFEIATVKVAINGTSPLIIHKFSEKAQKMIEDKQAKKAKGGREVRIPEEEYQAALYYFSDGLRYGFPAGGFKAAMIRAGKQLGYVMADLKGWFFVVPDEKETNLVEIIGEPRMRTDMVRIGMGTADVRYRPEFQEWGAILTIEFNTHTISAEQIFELVALAGFSCGIGDWRPEKSATGNFGTWKPELLNELRL